MIFAVDLDGVLADFNVAFVKLLIRYGADRTLFRPGDPEWPDRWAWYDQATPSAVLGAWGEAQNSQMFWRYLFPYPTAKKDFQTLNTARDQGHDIYFLTTRPGKTAKRETEEWIYWQGFCKPTVIITKDGTKHLVTESIQADMIVDDKPANLYGHHEGCKRFLIDRPYNREAKFGYGQRVSTVSEALNIMGIKED